MISVRVLRRYFVLIDCRQLLKNMGPTADDEFFEESIIQALAAENVPSKRGCDSLATKKLGFNLEIVQLTMQAMYTDNLLHISNSKPTAGRSIVMQAAGHND